MNLVFSRERMSWENEINLSDVNSAGLVVTDRIGGDVASHLDLEEALEASRYSSHPYSTHPREVSILLLLSLYMYVCMYVFNYM